jgi:dihydroorotate dehydrogenase
MSVEKEVSDRLDELHDFIVLLRGNLGNFVGDVGLEINFSCPNTGLDPSHLINEVGQALDIAGSLQIPLQCKFNATVPVKAICEVATHRNCDAITMSNTIPWGKLTDRIDWTKLFGKISPLETLGGGGLSGPALFPIVCAWIEEARDCNIAKPIWACGGIFSAEDVSEVAAKGASGIQMGTVALHAPEKTRRIIAQSYEVFPF